MTTHEVAIVGGGAAGLSAALVLGRARRSVVVIDAGQPRNAPAAHMQGFLSRDGLPPSELLVIGRGEVASYGVEFVDGTVARIAARPDGRFDLTTATGTTRTARRVLVTTGLRDHAPDVPGVAERWGRDVLHCPYCHGYEVRDQALGVLGGTPGAVQHALLIRQWSANVTYFPHTTEPTDAEREQLTARGIDIVDGSVSRLVVEDDRLSGVELADGRFVARAAVFVRPEFTSNSTLLRDLGVALDAGGFPPADSTGQTSVPGVWVAGNAVNPRAQVITAAGEGSATAIAINNDLTDEDTCIAVDALRAG
jgi:thioredoxin reductase